jgi:hypothetical protein
VPIDEHAPQPLSALLKAGHGADTNRGVTSEDKHCVLRWSRMDRRGDLAGAGDKRIGARCPGFRRFELRERGRRAMPRRLRGWLSSGCCAMMN